MRLVYTASYTVGMTSSRRYYNHDLMLKLMTKYQLMQTCRRPADRCPGAIHNPGWRGEGRVRVRRPADRCPGAIHNPGWRGEGRVRVRRPADRCPRAIHNPGWRGGVGLGSDDLQTDALGPSITRSGGGGG